jgi:hypothetical protein
LLYNVPCFVRSLGNENDLTVAFTSLVRSKVKFVNRLLLNTFPTFTLCTAAQFLSAPADTYCRLAVSFYTHDHSYDCVSGTKRPVVRQTS